MKVLQSNRSWNQIYNIDSAFNLFFNMLQETASF